LGNVLQDSANQRGSSSRAIPLWALAIPPTLAVALWLVGETLVFTPESFVVLRASAVFFVTWIACILSALVLIYKLVRVPSSRRWPTYGTLLASVVVVLVPALVFLQMAMLARE